ncbi:hypothetical protein V2J09_008939, partial [Rumex salicifolius]
YSVPLSLTPILLTSSASHTQWSSTRFHPTDVRLYCLNPSRFGYKYLAFRPDSIVFAPCSNPKHTFKLICHGRCSIEEKEVAAEEYVSLSQLVEGLVVSVKVMVCRKWDSTNSFGKYMSTEYLLSDAEGNVMHCSFRSSISHRFVALLEEGSVFSFKNFSLLVIKEKFRIRKDDRHIISLEDYTVVNKISFPTDSFVRFPFQFTAFEDIETNDSAYLIVLPKTTLNYLMCLRNTESTGRLKESLPPKISLSPVFQLLRVGREQKDTHKRSCNWFVPPGSHYPASVEQLEASSHRLHGADSWKLAAPRRRRQRATVGLSPPPQTQLLCRFFLGFRSFLSNFRDREVASYLSDSTGSMVITVFDDVAEKLIPTTAAILLEERGDNGDENVLPEALLTLTNTKHAFKVKSHTYYYDHDSYESFTANKLVGSPDMKRDCSDMSGDNSPRAGPNANATRSTLEDLFTVDDEGRGNGAGSNLKSKVESMNLGLLRRTYPISELREEEDEESDCEIRVSGLQPAKKDFKKIAGSFWIAASVFSRKLQKWKRKQKNEKPD